MRISDWSSDVCSSDLIDLAGLQQDARGDVLCGSGTFDPPTTKLDANGQGSPYATYGFAAQIAEVAVDLDLGTVKVLRMAAAHRSEEHTSELQSLMRISYAVFCLKKKKKNITSHSLITNSKN